MFIIRARPIKFLGPIPKFFNFHCRYLMPISLFFVIQPVSILLHEAKGTLLELFCLQPNIFKLQLKDITVHIFLQATQTKKIISQVTIIL